MKLFPFTLSRQSGDRLRSSSLRFPVPVFICNEGYLTPDSLATQRFIRTSGTRTTYTSCPLHSVILFAAKRVGESIIWPPQRRLFHRDYRGIRPRTFIFRKYLRSPSWNTSDPVILSRFCKKFCEFSSIFWPTPSFGDYWNFLLAINLLFNSAVPCCDIVTSISVTFGYAVNRFGDFPVFHSTVHHYLSRLENVTNIRETVRKCFSNSHFHF